MSEIELKFLLDEAGTRKLKSRLKTLPQATGPARTRSLRTLYYDTADHALRRAGIALRLRRDGRRWVQTVKLRARMHSGVSEAKEYDSPAPGGRLDLSAIPSPQVAAEVSAAIGDKPLGIICETAMRRTSNDLRLENGTEAELAIDSGEIKAGDRAEPFREAEVELVRGGVGTLFELTRDLFPSGGLRFSMMSKAERGYLLAAEGRIGSPLTPRLARAVPLAQKQTAETAARDVLRECFEQIAENVAVLSGSDDPEGPHQLRVGLRRLRSAFSMFKPLIGNAEMARLNGEARWLGQVVGELRDLDVAIEDILDPEAKAQPAEPGFPALRKAIVARGVTKRAEVRNVLISDRVHLFLLDLARFTETRGWLVAEDFAQTAQLAAPVPRLARRALEKRWKSVQAHARGIDHLDIEARHALRKELKKMRYAVEFFGPLWSDKKVRSFGKSLKRLQQVFGDLNDAAMASALLLGPQAPGASDPDAQRAVGWILGSRTARAETDWHAARGLWHDLRALGPFWA